VTGELAARVARHEAVSTALAALDDRELGALVDRAPVVAVGIGGTAVAIEVDGVPVFAKRVALTDLERRQENVGSTANLFRLPTFTHYGIGSAGGGVWRELAAHVMTTSWVLDGRCGSFPLLHHWRVLDGSPPVVSTPRQRAEQVAYWNGSPAVADRLDAIADASAAVVLFCEYLPTTLHDWLTAQVAAGAVDAACAMVERELPAAVSFMNANGLLHFDAHFTNVLTDGRHLYLTDFGLATSPTFDLSADERAFVDAHADHDPCYVVTHLVNWLVAALTGATDRADRVAFVRRCAATSTTDATGWMAHVAGRTGHMCHPPGLWGHAADVIRRYAPIAVVLNDFYDRLVGQSRLTPYPADELRRAVANGPPDMASYGHRHRQGVRPAEAGAAPGFPQLRSGRHGDARGSGGRTG